MLELLANIASLFSDFRFWRKKKARLAFEKEQNLPKKVMLDGITILFIIVILVIISLRLYR